MGEALVMRGELKGHNGWVTCLATSMEKYVDFGVGSLLQADRNIAPTCFYQAAETSH